MSVPSLSAMLLFLACLASLVVVARREGGRAYEKRQSLFRRAVHGVSK